MIITKIYGGLGNQLFQYAIGRCLSEQKNVPFFLDISQFDNYKLRGYNLGEFNITENFANKDISNRYSFFESSKLNNICNKLMFNNGYIREKTFDFDENLFKINHDEIYLEGYWQNEKYFSSINNILRNEFTLRNPLSDNAKNTENLICTTSDSVSVHVRKTDFLKKENKKIFTDLTASYYENAIQNIVMHLKNPHLFVFSDDFTWVKENIHFDLPITYIDSNNPAHEDLHLMSQCKHNIIANSTFSWWGAWLNKNTEKMVIGPENWFSNGRSVNPFRVESWMFI
jgi:hypothetical protein